MQNRLRDIRKARGLTLADVAARCDPATTAVTIGRLETGTRQLSVGWMERLAHALDVDPKALIAPSADPTVPVAAALDVDGAVALTGPMALHPPVPVPGTIGLLVRASLGDYRAGDQLWLEQLPPDRYTTAINLDVLVPRPVGRFAFGRLIATEGPRLQVLPLRSATRQTVIADAPWIARVHTLIRPMLLP